MAIFTKFKKCREDGQILVTLIIIVPALVLIVASYLALSSSSYRLSRQDQFHTQAQMAADAGTDFAIEQVNQDNNWSGTGGEVTLQSDSSKKVTYAVAIANNSSSSKTLTVTGRTYWPASATSSAASVIIKVDLRAVSSGNYSVVSGEGGLFMNNYSKIVGGNALINGTITLSNSAQIGLSTNPVSVSVADQVCPKPADSTYPRICNPGENDNPISISNTSHIYGDVKANNQLNPYSANMTNHGLVASSGVVPQALPNYDRNSQKGAVTNTISGGFSCNNGTETWPANTKIEGDVSISNKCKITVAGNVWITGNLTVANSADLVVADTLGTTMPVIMVDGSSGVVLSQSAQLLSNSSNTGFEVITFWSASSCSPDCSDVTGLDLYNSRGVTTISLQNSSQGPQTVFYSRWTQVLVNNSGQIGALVGQTVSMSNTATITFGTSAPGFGLTFWVVNGYRRGF